MSQEREKDYCAERLIDFEAERLMIGNILARGLRFWRVVGQQLTDECFAVERFRRVFALQRGVAEAGGDPGLEGCFNSVLSTGHTIEEMGLPVLSELAFENQIELANPAMWVGRLRRKAAERRAFKAAERLRLALETGEGSGAEIAAAREELRAIEGTLEAPGETGSTIASTLGSIGIETLLAAPRGTIASPWRRLNELTNGGPGPGQLWIVGARPSVGKTTVALQWALAAAAAGNRVVFASLEMPTADLIKRAMSAEGNIPHALLVRGDLEQSWRFRFAETLERIGEYPLEITDRVRTLSAVIGKAASAGVKLLVVDYLGLVEPGGRYENRNQEVSTISRRLKLAALDYGIPIIAAHQLNRASENQDRAPQLSDLRDSGGLEQDADVVLLLDAPGNRGRRPEAPKDLVEMAIAKQRNGVRGYTISLRLEGQFCRVTERIQEQAA